MNTVITNNTELKLEKKGKDEDILKKYIALFIDNWYWFVLSVVICGGLSVLYLSYANRMCKVNVTVLVQDPDSGG